MFIKNKPVDLFLFPIVICALLFLCATTAFGGNKQAESQKRLPVFLDADDFIANQDSRYGVFSGNVVVKWGGATLTCDRLEAYFRENSPEMRKKNTGNMEKMIASGKVQASFEDKRAFSDRAVYTSADDRLVMSGGPPLLIVGESRVTGPLVILNRKTGDMSVEGDKSHRVKATFNPADRPKSPKK